ncbi:MAG: acetylornithine deacetylase [Albidovulum sp.]|nr:acetylornithine deacetylase [Albidovulum sp.]
MNSLEILDKLVAIPVVAGESNLEIVDCAKHLLGDLGFEIDIVPDPASGKANLFATVGPSDSGRGVILSGHTDVVSVQGQNWQSDPFRLTKKNGRLFGRGAADMKGFLACAIAGARRASRRKLRRPLHLALSYDEELGCVGAVTLVDFIAEKSVSASSCIVGEPTSMDVATGHKGKTALRAHCYGRECHSSRAPLSVNAVHVASDLIGSIRAMQKQLESRGCRDEGYEIPYSTLHVGRIEGGTALNIVPNRCEIEFELRSLVGDDAQGILDEIRLEADRIAAGFNSPEAKIEIEQVVSYPGLDTPENSPAAALAKDISGCETVKKVDFGTEGGLFAQKLNVPTVICGPGSMEQGHGPDEFVEVAQLRRCDEMLDALVERLVDGR